ncbi:hypothetical protein [Clostridium rectalis]|uniref:hypothetical protein n=1 Tax=Clostridium rectalis TaxID=2040295 RepID=UPI000F633A00|nr:hypothetical protein [Clostridium rectalis]
MKKNKKFIIVITVLCLFLIVFTYKYSNYMEKSNFEISQLDWSGEGKFWADNSKFNNYNIKFQFFNGKDIKQITSHKSSYDMKINSKVKSGDLLVKIYNDQKTLYEEKSPINKTINISDKDNKNIKIELTGIKAKGQTKIIFK